MRGEHSNHYTRLALLASHALVVEDLVQGMDDFYQIGLIGHDLIDVFVGRRDFINKRCGSIFHPHAVTHLLTQILLSKSTLCF